MIQTEFNFENPTTKKSNKIVIFTDASLRNNVATWSFCFKLKGKSQPEVFTGLCPQEIQTSSQAEVYAILKAVELVRERFSEINSITIQTDCQGLINCLKEKGKRTDYKVNRDIQNAIVNKTFRQGVKLNVHYVRAHTGSNSPAAKMNRLVDMSARKFRREEEKRISLTQSQFDVASVVIKKEVPRSFWKQALEKMIMVKDQLGSQIYKLHSFSYFF